LKNKPKASLLKAFPGRPPFAGGGRRPPPLWRMALGTFFELCSQSSNLYAYDLRVQVLGNEMLGLRCLLCPLNFCRRANACCSAWAAHVSLQPADLPTLASLRKPQLTSRFSMPAPLVSLYPEARNAANHPITK
jgi:hypothetical protein